MKIAFGNKRFSSWKLSLGFAVLITTSAVVIESVSSPMPTNTTVPVDPVPSPNAADYLRAAGQLLTGPIGPAGDLPIPATPGMSKAILDDPRSGYHVFSLAEDDAIIKENRSALWEAEKGLPYAFDFVNYSASSSPPMFEKVFRLAGRTQAAHGHWGAAMAYYLDGLMLGVDVLRGGDFGGTGYEDDQRLSLQAALPHLNAFQCRQAASEFVNLDRLTPSPVTSAITEKRIFLSEYLDLFKQSGWRKGYENGAYLDPDHPPSTKARLANFIGSMLESPRTAYRNCDSYFDHTITYFNQSWPDQLRSRQPEEPTDPLNAPLAGQSAMLGEINFWQYKSIALNRLIDVQLALRAYMLDRRHYPVGLVDLVPQYLPAVPIDPFSGGQPLRYRTTSTGYLLYSIGPDAIDDGGRPIRNDKPGRQPFHGNIRNQTGDIVAGVNF